MTNEQLKVILDLGETMEQLARMVVGIDRRLEALERHVEQLRPRNEYNLTPEDAEFFQRINHTLKHADCPWVKDGSRCASLEREFTSFNSMDWIPIQKDILRRLDAIEYSLPKDIRADINAAMGRGDTNHFDGVPE